MKNKNQILFTICLVSMLVPFPGSSLNLALPTLAADLSMNAVGQAWMVTIFMLPAAILLVPMGKLADIIGLKKVLITGTALFTIATVACGLAQSDLWLLTFRFVQGVAGAMLFSTSTAILVLIFPKEERGKVIGINTSFVYFALASGPVLGGLLTQHFGWRSIFFVTALIGLIAFLGLLTFLKGEWKVAAGEKYDYGGAALFLIGAFSIIYGFTILGEPMSWVLIGGGAIAMTLFVHYEKKCTHPIYDIMEFLRNRVFKMSLAAACINYAATFAIGFWLSLYLQYVKGLSPQLAGMILLSQPFMMMLVSPWAGRRADKMDASRLATGGMALIVVCLGGLYFLSTQTPLAVAVLLLLFLGIGFGLFSSPNMQIIMSSVDKRHYAMASASAGTVRQTGQAFSMAITMMMMHTFVGQVDITPAVYPQLMSGMHWTFAILAVLSCAGVYTSMVRKKAG